MSGKWVKVDSIGEWKWVKVESYVKVSGNWVKVDSKYKWKLGESWQLCNGEWKLCES